MSSLLYPFLNFAKPFPSDFGSLTNIRDDIAGTSVSAMIRLAPREYVTVNAISVKSCLVIPSTKTIGANTHTVVRVDDVIAAATSLAPAMAAFLADIPSLLILKMFSITTMELSTSIPTATARPDREIMFRVTPEKYISTIAKVMLIGMLRRVIKVGFISLRKRSRIKTANSAPQPRLCMMELIIRYM